ncbi:MAG: hypothetical protein A4E27_00949 [Methanobacterium sp. PtaU1.Bin242]|nr:MAG: hypothetical protein A4E27_00949 [Methanobacterium sp. PtaU1.Bin242]
MYCPNCGNEIERGRFCPNCGQDIEPAVPMDEDRFEENVDRFDESMEPVKSPTSKYSVNEFVSDTIQKGSSGETFELENKYMLNVNLNGKVWAKKGAMVAYNGDVKFSREGTMEHGLDKFVKKAVTGEASTLMKMKGRGQVYLADSGKEVTVLNLQNDKIYVNGNDLLAFEDRIDWDIKMTATTSGMMSGGLFNIRLQGTGMVAITTHYTPVTMVVTPDKTIYTDPNATVAWSGGLTPSIKTDIDFKTLLGKDSGETFQMKFRGHGFVIVQPYEER